MHVNEVPIDVSLVRGLVSSQFPEFSDRSIEIVEPWGTDNAIFRIGEDHVVRLPRIGWAANQVEFEATWLPRFAPHLGIAIPEPVAVGEATEEYPFAWALHRWLPGHGASLAAMRDPARFARDLARTVAQVWALPSEGAPAAKNRARPLADYDDETRAAIDRAAHLIDASAALAAWEDAVAAPAHPGPAVWVHGDLEGNCLLRDGRLSGLIDWGLACAGDPATDVQVVWSPLFDQASRSIFLEALDIDDATIARSRGAAINQACGALPYYLDTYPLIVERSWHKLAELGVGPA